MGWAVHFPWDDRNIALLRKLWDEGHSASEIGRRMGVSKNAVVGKAGRLGLQPRPSPILPRSIAKPVALSRQRAKGVTLPPMASLAEPSPPSSRPAPRAERLAMGGRGVRAVPPQIAAKPEPAQQYSTSITCQYPQWPNNARPTHQYCGAPALLGTSWCDECRAKVWTTGSVRVG